MAPVTFTREQQRERSIAMSELQEHVQGTAKEGGKEKRGLGINQVLLVGRFDGRSKNGGDSNLDQDNAADRDK